MAPGTKCKNGFLDETVNIPIFFKPSTEFQEAKLTHRFG
jgi:hypothetical protein